MPSTEKQSYQQTTLRHETETDRLTSGGWVIGWVIVSAVCWLVIGLVWVLFV